MKHHSGTLPYNFSESVMPEFNASQLQKKITRVALSKMYDYKNTLGSCNTSFKANCAKIWNQLPLELKALPYASSREVLLKNTSFKIQNRIAVN